MNKKYILIILILVIILSLFIYNIFNNENKIENIEINNDLDLVITQEKAKELIDNNNPIIIDVREEYEYNSGHIKDAILSPLGNIENNIVNITNDKNDLILVYCRSGNRSNTAANKLLDLGYTNVHDIGGIIDWKYEIVK